MPKRPSTVTVPADYQVWLDGLRKQLGKRHGAKADLARFLAEEFGLKPRPTEVRLSKIINQGVEPGAAFFLAIAVWQQMQTAE